MQSGKVKDGLRVDEWVSRFAGEDSVSTRMFYKEGKLNGEYTNYGATGEVEVQGVFRDDVREGEWTWYQAGGSVESKVMFVKGKKEGEQMFYDAYDELLKTEVYKGGKLVETRVE